MKIRVTKLNERVSEKAPQLELEMETTATPVTREMESQARKALAFQ